KVRLQSARNWRIVKDQRFLRGARQPRRVRAYVPASRVASTVARPALAGDRARVELAVLLPQSTRVRGSAIARMPVALTGAGTALTQAFAECRRGRGRRGSDDRRD